MAKPRLLKSIGVGGTAAALVALMTFANLASGAARIETGRPHGRITIVRAKLSPAHGLAAGDRIQRLLELKTGGATRARMVVTAKKPSPLTDRQLGLRIEVARCSKSWRARGLTFVCTGRTSRVLASEPALGRHALRKLAARGKNHLRLTLTLPASAPRALQGQSAELVYSFRAGR